MSIHCRTTVPETKCLSSHLASFFWPFLQIKQPERRAAVQMEKLRWTPCAHGTLLALHPLLESRQLASTAISGAQQSSWSIMGDLSVRETWEVSDPTFHPKQGYLWDQTRLFRALVSWLSETHPRMKAALLSSDRLLLGTGLKEVFSIDAQWINPSFKNEK